MTQRKHGTTVIVGDNLTASIRKFKRKVDESGILPELQRRQAYEKPTTKRKRKHQAAKNRWERFRASEQLPRRMF